MNATRKYLASTMFIGCALAATPLVAAPSETAVESGSPVVAVPEDGLNTDGLRDEAAMVLIGGALIGLAAAVRRAA